jgi:CubicO group peptidase (beta-lactamase class C family)
VNLSILLSFFLGIYLPIVAFGQNATSSASGNKYKIVDKVLKSKQRVLGGDVCLLIYKDGKIILERDLGNFTKYTSAPVASCSKWFTAALAMTFIDAGLISPDDTIGKYLPVFTNYHKGFITIRQCLSHTTGVESEQINLWTLLERRKYNSLADEVNNFALKPLAGQPGKVFGYSSVGLNIVGRIMELVSEKDFESIFQEYIAKPLGMKNTTFSKTKAVNPSGGAYSTASDYMNFLSMILNKGVCKGKRIISPEAINEMQISRTAGLKIIYTPPQTEGYEYAYGEWILEKDKNGNSKDRKSVV